MLLSHKYKFIFIKTHKTAGTSIEVDIAKLLGPDDVITPVLPPVPGHEPRNDRGDSWLARKLRRTYWNHMPATAVRRLAGRKVFDGYFKFCVEREPVSKCLSLYSMLINSPDHGKGSKQLTWDGFVERGRFPENASSWLDDDGTLLVDRIIRYENLHAELAEVAASLGFTLDKVEAKAKTGFREPIEVTESQRRIIYDGFARSLPFTGYTL